MSLELAKKKLELSKVQCALEEIEVKIMEREEDIKRLKDSSIVQKEKIEELNNYIAQMQ